MTVDRLQPKADEVYPVLRKQVAGRRLFYQSGKETWLKPSVHSANVSLVADHSYLDQAGIREAYRTSRSLADESGALMSRAELALKYARDEILVVKDGENDWTSQVHDPVGNILTDLLPDVIIKISY